MISALLKYSFLQNALLSGILASVVCGIIGVIIVEKKLVMMSGGIAHTSYGGVGLGYLLGFEPIIGAFAFSVIAALGIGYIKRKGGAHSDLIIGLFWSVGMALGILFIAMMPGYPPDMSSYLFGSILSVTRADLVLISVLTLVVLLSVVCLYNYWKAYIFDSEFMTILGVRTGFLEYLLLIMVAITVVVLIRVVGIVLVIALLTAPAATAGLIASGFRSRIVYSVLLGAFFCVAGLFISYELAIASGASIVVLSALCYMAVYAAHIMLTRRKAKKCVNQNI